jgi:glutamate-1-semialdehyde 2,1-aminomutase
MRLTERHYEALAVELAAVEAHYTARHPKSAERHAFAERHLPGGNTRSVLYYRPFPLTWVAGHGNRLIDLDGFEYLDLLGEFSAGLYGHSNAVVRDAMVRAIDDGLVLGGPNQYEARLAEAIRARFPSMELVRFTNSGTEANLFALSAARAMTGRTRVMTFAGAYHGGVFDFGTPAPNLNVPFNWLVGTYNDVAGTREALREHASTLAAVIVEPMLGKGCVPGNPEFLRMLRAETADNDVLLIFDEVMTSRLSPSGLQGVLGVKPDLTTLGKYFGGGASFGAMGGRRDLMGRFDPSRVDSFAHAGTFNNNVISMAGGLAGLTEVFTPTECARLNALGDALRNRLNELSIGRQASLQASGVGSLIGLNFTPVAAPCHPGSTSVHEDRFAKALADIQSLFHLDLLDQGFYFARRGYIALSLPTMEADCDRFASAVDEFLARHGTLIAAAAVRAGQ